MSGVLSRIMPARAQAQTPRLIADLDQLVPRPMGFILHGKEYRIEVGTVRKLAQMSEHLERILELLARKAQGEKISDDRLYEAYHEYLSVLCPQMTLGTLKTMTFPQLRRLLKEIVRYATGQQSDTSADELEAEKKKTLT